MCCNFWQRKHAKGKANAGQSGPAQGSCQTSQGQQPTQASQAQQPTQGSQVQQPTEASQVEESTQPSQVIEPTQQYHVQEPTPTTQASQVVNPIQEPTDAVINASQGSAENTTQSTQSLFDDLSDEIMAAIPDVDASQCSRKNERTVRGKKDKMKRVSALYYGKETRSSERVKQNAFKKPITSPGASQEAPIEITGQEDIADDSKLGTCFRAMKSWKDIPKKKK
jgi:hypothetical protein